MESEHIKVSHYNGNIADDGNCGRKRLPEVHVLLFYGHYYTVADSNAIQVLFVLSFHYISISFMEADILPTITGIVLRVE